MRHVMMVVVGIGLVWASAENCFARGPQGSGQRNMTQMQARHWYGGQFQGMGQGQGQMMGQGQTWPQDAVQSIDNTTTHQGNKGNGLQQRKRGGNYQGAAKTQTQNRARTQKSAGM